MELGSGDPETPPRSKLQALETAGCRVHTRSITAGPHQTRRGGLSAAFQLPGGLPAGQVGRGQLLEFAGNVRIMPENPSFPPSGQVDEGFVDTQYDNSFPEQMWRPTQAI